MSSASDLSLPVPGALLRYRDEGSGPPVLLIHGWSLDLDMWEPQVAALAEFRLVRFDRRGFGLSSGHASLAADVQDVLTLCDRLELGRLACVGMSQGARVALQLCRVAPERLACVVLDGPPRGLAEDANARAEVAAGSAPEASSQDVPLSEYRALIARGEVAAFRRAWLRHPLMQLETSDPAARALLTRMSARYRGEDLVQEPAAAPEPSNRPLLSSLATPALIVTGERDLPGRVRAADALAAALPCAERAIIPSARHLPNLDNPRAYNAVLRAFLERCAGPTPQET